MGRDAMKFARLGEQCQRFATAIHQPSELLTLILALWPFAQWGINLIGPLPTGKGQTKFVVVAVDYFTKWAKAEPLATIIEANITSFVWTNLVCRFGIPYAIVSDNASFCAELGIKHFFSSPTYP